MTKKKKSKSVKARQPKPMTISSLVKALRVIKANHGDLPILVLNPDKLTEGEYVTERAFIIYDNNYGADDKESVDGLIFADRETVISVSE